jgi:hypothetical protein
VVRRETNAVLRERKVASRMRWVARRDRCAARIQWVALKKTWAAKVQEKWVSKGGMDSNERER